MQHTANKGIVVTSGEGKQFGEPDMKSIVEIFAQHGMKVLIPEAA